jgi:hypothetical protein
MDHLIASGERLPVEVLESLVRSYLVRPRAEAGGRGTAAPSVGDHVALVIGDNPPVPCTVAAREGEALRLLRGTARLAGQK